MEKFCHFVFSGLWIVGQYYLLLIMRYIYIYFIIFGLMILKEKEGPCHQSEKVEPV